MNKEESIPLLSTSSKGKRKESQWTLLADAIDRFCYIILPLIFIIYNIKKFKAVGVI